MISNVTLQNKPTSIGLGWLDDSMKITGVTEEDTHFIADTGSTATDMQDHVNAYEANIRALQEKVVSLGGFYWQMMKGSVPQVAGSTRPYRKGSPPPKYVGPMPPAQCKTTLRQYCVPEPPQWGHMAHYDIRPDNATNTTQALQLTAQFLVRGDFLPCHLDS